MTNKEAIDGLYTGSEKAVDHAIDVLERYERGELVEVVRCRDCEYSFGKEECNGNINCELTDDITHCLGFCDYGKLKGESHDG